MKSIILYLFEILRPKNLIKNFYLKVSVIQRTPSAKSIFPETEETPSIKKEMEDEKEPMEMDDIPMQEDPIDYHVPKKTSSPPPRIIKKYDIKILIPILKKLIVEKYKKMNKNKGPELKLSEEELLKFLERFHGLQKFVVAPGGAAYQDQIMKRRFLKAGMRKTGAAHTTKIPSMFESERISRRYFEQKNIKELGFLNRKPMNGLYYGSERTQPNYIAEREAYLMSAERKKNFVQNLSTHKGNGAGFPGKQKFKVNLVSTNFLENWFLVIFLKIGFDRFC